MKQERKKGKSYNVLLMQIGQIKNRKLLQNLNFSLQPNITQKKVQIHILNKRQEMNLKQHNDIVQRLLQQIDSKDKQITQLNKQLSQKSKTTIDAQKKSTKAQQPTEIQKQVQKRITQLNKQHNSKVNQLSQQIKTLTQQNGQLKQRLAMKGQMDAKENQRVAQVMRRNNIQRKAGSKEDLKISALISHYQQEMNKKNGFIETLKRQVKSLSMKKIQKQQTRSSQISGLRQQLEIEQFQEEDQEAVNDSLRKAVSLVEHNKAVEKLQRETVSLRGELQNRDKEIKDVRLKYTQLTKQYYRVVNQYGVAKEINTNTVNKPPLLGRKKILSKNQTLKQPAQINPRTNLSQTLLSSQGGQMSFTLSEEESFGYDNEGDATISMTFQQNFMKFNNNKNNKQSEEDIIPQVQHLSQKSSQELRQQQSSINNIENKLSQLQTLFTQIMQTLNLSEKSQIIPFLTDIMTRNNFLQINQQIIQHLQEFMYNYGMGKVSKSSMIQVLSLFQEKCQKWLHSHDLLDQICIQIGAKRPKLLQKINYYKQAEQQYIQKMKSPQFLTEINKSSKLLQFIQFFQLDKSQLQLPQQLKNIYQQLKYVDKFIKQANCTLNVELRDRKGLQGTLELILRKLEKYYHWEVEIQREGQRKATRKMEKVKHNLS